VLRRNPRPVDIGIVAQRMVAAGQLSAADPDPPRYPPIKAPTSTVDQSVRPTGVARRRDRR
jgi:hypothetical protein